MEPRRVAIHRVCTKVKPTETISQPSAAIALRFATDFMLVVAPPVSATVPVCVHVHRAHTSSKAHRPEDDERDIGALESFGPANG